MATRSARVGHALLTFTRLVEVERRIDAGDRDAARVFEAMVYQIGKEAGAMAVALKGKIFCLRE